MTQLLKTTIVSAGNTNGVFGWLFRHPMHGKVVMLVSNREAVAMFAVAPGELSKPVKGPSLWLGNSYRYALSKTGMWIAAIGEDDEVDYRTLQHWDLSSGEITMVTITKHPDIDGEYISYGSHDDTPVGKYTQGATGCRLRPTLEHPAINTVSITTPRYNGYTIHSMPREGAGQLEILKDYVPVYTLKPGNSQEGEWFGDTTVVAGHWLYVLSPRYTNDDVVVVGRLRVYDLHDLDTILE